MHILSDQQFAFILNIFINFITRLKKDLNPELDKQSMVINYPGLTARFKVTPYDAWLYLELPGIGKRPSFKLGRKGRRINQRVINDLQVYAHKHYGKVFSTAIEGVKTSVEKTDIGSVIKNGTPLRFKFLTKTPVSNHFELNNFILKDFIKFDIFVHKSLFNKDVILVTKNHIRPSIVVNGMAPIFGLDEDINPDESMTFVKSKTIEKEIKSFLTSAIIEEIS